jgi:hypothetical protein
MIAATGASDHLSGCTLRDASGGATRHAWSGTAAVGAMRRDNGDERKLTWALLSAQLSGPRNGMKGAGASVTAPYASACSRVAAGRFQ